jgi:heme exporter protein C
MKPKLFFLFAAISAALLVYSTYQGLYVAPTEETMGNVQRIFYVHVPAATVGFTMFFINFVFSILYLWKRSPVADAAAVTTAEVGVVFCTVVLITGPIWARYAWGVWWASWDMRLKTTLLLWLLYISYLVLRRSASGGSTSVLASALAIFAFLDVPMVYMANRWFQTQHPPPMVGTPNLDQRMQNILFLNMIAFMLFGALIAWFRYELERTAQKINAAYVRRAAGGGAALLLLPLMFQQTPQHVNPMFYLWGGYLAAWVIYIGYLLFLMSRLAKLKKEEAELRTA